MGTEKEALAAAVVAFEGVVAAGPQQLAGQWEAGFADVAFTFAVEKTIKGGPLPERLHIATSANGASCGAGFAVGQRWRVYTSLLEGGGGPLYSGLCSGNQLLAESVEIPALPASGGGNPSGQDSVPVGVVLAIGVAALLAVASALAFRRGGVGRSH